MGRGVERSGSPVAVVLAFLAVMAPGLKRRGCLKVSGIPHRRAFLRGALAFALANGGSGSVRAAQDSSGPRLDRFGGWTGRRFRATGYFRTEKDDRWWLVTPDGNAFLSFGINHLHPHFWNQHYNREAWKARLGLDALQGLPFQATLREWFLRTCRDYGFNSVGVHTSLDVVNTPAPSLPYVQPIRFVEIPHWKTEIPDENFLDVYSEEFALRCDRMAERIAAPLRKDPYLLGYAMTDCPLLTEEDCRERPDVIGGARRKARIGWPRRLRNLGADAPGKQAYVGTVRSLYRDRIDDFNATYGTEFGSFEALAAAQNWRPRTDLSNAAETRDNIDFLQRTVARYYKTAQDAILRHDPNHLFFGDKLNANTDSLDTVLSTTGRFTDIVFYQMYGRYEVQEPGLNRWSAVADKPLINGDSAFTMITETMPRPFGPIADDLEQRILWIEEFFYSAFARPDFVGWHYCGLIDATNQVDRKQDRQHSGLMDGLGRPYPQLQPAIARCSANLYNAQSGPES